MFVTPAVARGVTEKLLYVPEPNTKKTALETNVSYVMLKNVKPPGRNCEVIPLKTRLDVPALNVKFVGV